MLQTGCLPGQMVSFPVMSPPLPCLRIRFYTPPPAETVDETLDSDDTSGVVTFSVSATSLPSMPEDMSLENVSDPSEVDEDDVRSANRFAPSAESIGSEYHHCVNCWGQQLP